MGLQIGGYAFEGPYSSTDHLKDLSGIYVIVDLAGGQYYPVDCGESAMVKTRVSGHDRADSWKKCQRGSLQVAVLYTPGAASTGRVAIEQRIRSTYTFPCGKR